MAAEEIMMVSNASSRRTASAVEGCVLYLAAFWVIRHQVWRATVIILVAIVVNADRRASRTASLLLSLARVMQFCAAASARILRM